MSVQKNRSGGHDVRWRENGRQFSKTFRRRRDAECFDLKVKDAKQTGGLPQIEGGTTTLDDYVEKTWTPIHGAALAPKTATLYALLYDNHISPKLGGLPTAPVDARGHRPLASRPARRGRAR